MELFILAALIFSFVLAFAIWRLLLSSFSSNYPRNEPLDECSEKPGAGRCKNGETKTREVPIRNTEDSKSNNLAELSQLPSSIIPRSVNDGSGAPGDNDEDKKVIGSREYKQEPPVLDSTDSDDSFQIVNRPSEFELMGEDNDNSARIAAPDQRTSFLSRVTGTLRRRASTESPKSPTSVPNTTVPNFTGLPTLTVDSQPRSVSACGREIVDTSRDDDGAASSMEEMNGEAEESEDKKVDGGSGDRMNKMSSADQKDEDDGEEKNDDEMKSEHDEKSDENKSDEEKSDENKSDENKSDENKSDENKSDEEKSDEEKSDNDSVSGQEEARRKKLDWVRDRLFKSARAAGKVERRKLRRREKPKKKKNVDDDFPTVELPSDEDEENNSDISEDEWDEDDDSDDEFHIDSTPDLEQAESFKAQGNEAFKNEDHSAAINFYTKALLKCPSENSDTLVSVLLCNRGACHLAQRRFEDVLADCTDALEFDDKYVKAYLRRFRANEALEKWHDALADINKAIEIDPSLKSPYYGVQKKVEKLSQDQFEKEKAELIDKMKTFGNWALGKFGLSLDNFKLEQNADTGAYNIQFVQGGNSSTSSAPAQ